MYKIKQYCLYCNHETLQYKVNLVTKCKSNNSTFKFKVIQKNLNSAKYPNKQEIFICAECKKCSLNTIKNIDLPNPYYKMDDDLKEMYNEAKSIFNSSLRGALGLLRCIFENLLIRKFSIKNPTKISEILKNQQINKSLGKNIIDSANNFKNTCNAALHSFEMDQESIRSEISIYFDWINKLAWVIYDSNIIVDKSKNVQQTNNFSNNNKNQNSNKVAINNQSNKNNKQVNNKQPKNNNQSNGAINNLQSNQINKQQPNNKQNESVKTNNNQQINTNKQNHNNHRKHNRKKWNNNNKKEQI